MALLTSSTTSITEYMLRPKLLLSFVRFDGWSGHKSSVHVALAPKAHKLVSTSSVKQTLGSMSLLF